MVKFQVATPLAVVALTGLAYAAISAGISNAQAQPNLPETDLKAKVERLEKKVNELQNQVEQLQRAPVPLYTHPIPYLQAPLTKAPAHQQEDDKTRQDWKPFEFQGQTYYIVPLKPAQ